MNKKIKNGLRKLWLMRKDDTIFPRGEWKPLFLGVVLRDKGEVVEALYARLINEIESEAADEAI